jgi:hypothetical protein
MLLNGVAGKHTLKGSGEITDTQRTKRREREREKVWRYLETLQSGKGTRHYNLK